MCTARRARTPTRDLFSRGLDDTEQNVRAALDLARKLAAAPSFPEATQIRAEFVRERFAAIQVQARDLNGLAQHAFQQSVEHARTPAATGCGRGPARGTEHPAGARAAVASRMAGSQRGCGPAAGRSVADHDRVGAEMIERDIGRLADESLRLCFRQAELAALMATAVQYACLDLYLEGYRTLATTLSVASDQRARTRRLIRRGVPPAEAARALHLV